MKPARAGATESKTVDVRLLADTSRDLPELRRRLKAVWLVMPPLRDRREDIRDMARFFRDKFNARYGQNGELTESAGRALSYRRWSSLIGVFRRATVYADPITSLTVASFAPPAHISSMAEREPASLSAAIASVTTVTSPIFISARAA